VIEFDQTRHALDKGARLQRVLGRANLVTLGQAYKLASKLPMTQSNSVARDDPQYEL
jgi:hypothetical protein